jgi:hypothetical protein
VDYEATLIGNPERLEGVEGYMALSAVLDSDGTVWLVPERGTHLEAAIVMVMAKLGVSKPEAIEAIQTGRVPDLGIKGSYHVGSKTFEKAQHDQEMSMGAVLKRTKAMLNG